LRFRKRVRSLGAATAVLAFAAVGSASAEPALWVVHGKNNSTVYLFGTVHALRPSVVWKSPKLDKAFAASQELWLEIADVGNPAAAAPLIQKYGLDLTGPPLSSKLDPAYQAKLAAAAQTVGMSTVQLDRMRPWLAGLALTLAPLVKAGYDPKSGVDVVLKAAADQKGEPVKGFETSEQQVRYLADLPQDQQIAFLKDTLDDFDKASTEFDQVEKIWEAGDVSRLAHELNGDLKAKAPKLYRLLIVDRNTAFAKAIEQKLSTPGVSFVAVGAGHLAGPDSVQAQLAKDGIRARRF
jgi:uncharacterized protein YbaP (TraB family)